MMKLNFLSIPFDLDFALHWIEKGKLDDWFIQLVS